MSGALFRLAPVSHKADRPGGRARLIAKAPLGELADEILLPLGFMVNENPRRAEVI